MCHEKIITYSGCLEYKIFSLRIGISVPGINLFIFLEPSISKHSQLYFVYTYIIN